MSALEARAEVRPWRPLPSVGHALLASIRLRPKGRASADADRALFAALTEPIVSALWVTIPSVIRAVRSSPFSPATAMPGFGLESVEARTSAEVSDPKQPLLRFIEH
jgi:hypothetical protein